MRKSLLPFLCLALAACQSDREFYASSAPADQAAPASRQLRLDWYGYQCFQFTSALGLKVLVNPFRPGTVAGKLPVELKPDVVLITSDEPSVNNDSAYDNLPVTFRGPPATGLNNASGIRVRGIPTVEDAGGAEKVNLAFSWTMDGVKIGYLGNIQRPFTSEELGQLGSVDVLFLPVGVPGSLNDIERNEIIRQTRAHIIIPMGPSSAVASANFAGFRTYPVPYSSVLISRDELLREPTVLILTAP